ncbi:MAG: DNA polymerase III subunit delta [Alphaproteobacteria bacterium]|nr:DNA polymerase III subunit delta [Alphaproteobacteria bacterium]
MIFKSVQIENYIKKPDDKIKAFLVYGSNDGLITDTVKRIARSVCPNLDDAFQVSELSGEDIAADFGKLYGEFNGQSLMGGRRVIMVSDASNQMTKELRKMLDETRADNLLILYADDLNKKSSLVKLAEEAPDMGCIACYEDKNEDIYNRLKTLDLTFEPQAIELLCARLSGDRMINLSELEKLKTYMGEAKNVTKEIVAKVISDQADCSTDDICYAVMEGNRAKAEVLYQRYITEGNEPVLIIRALSYHVMKLLNCLAGIEAGETMDKALKRLLPPLIFYRVEPFKQQLRMWNREKILRVLSLLHDAEKDCKTTNMPTKEIVDMTLMKIAGAARR